MRVGIVGGGPSGMMAAITAAKLGHNVYILEHNNRVGKKILSTGAGKCNLSNVDMDISHFHGGNHLLIENVLSIFNRDDTISFFSKLGLYTRNRNGYLYPFNEQASSVLDILRVALRCSNVDIFTDCNIVNIRLPKNCSEVFEVDTVISNDSENIKKSFTFDRLILATGSKAAPKTGSDGSGYNLAKKMGHTIVTPLPALCGLKCEGKFFKTIKGIRCRARVSLFIDGSFVASDEGEMQINDYGVSGIPVMQLSYIVAKALNTGKKAALHISFLPEFDKNSLVIFIKNRIQNNPDYSCEELLLSLFHKNLSIILLKRVGIESGMDCSLLSSRQIENLCECITSFEMIIRDTNSFEESQVCSGGVDLKEVDLNLQSKIIPGLYFAGEILDVNADCGGYNLQWAWSSGYLAGNLKK